MAVVDSDLKRRTIAYLLDNMRRSYPRIDRVYIGLCKLVTWQWLGGSSISSNYWHRGELDDLKVEECALVVRRSSAWKLVKGQCSQHHGFLCQTNQRKYLERKATLSHFPNISMSHFLLIIINTGKKREPLTSFFRRPLFFRRHFFFCHSLFFCCSLFFCRSLFFPPLTFSVALMSPHSVGSDSGLDQ